MAKENKDAWKVFDLYHGVVRLIRCGLVRENSL